MSFCRSRLCPRSGRYNRSLQRLFHFQHSLWRQYLRHTVVLSADVSITMLLVCGG